MKKKLALLLIILVLTIIPVATFGEEKYKVLTYIDYPSTYIEGNTIYIQGWVMSTIENEVDIYIDNEKVSSIERQERQDVLRQITGYGTKETNKLPGYKGEYDASKLQDGNHTLKISVKDKSTHEEIDNTIRTFTLKKYKITQYIDKPTGNISGENINIYGWVMTTAPNTSLEVYIDGKLVNDITRKVRSDVLNSIKGYGDKNNNPTPGFTGTYDASMLKDGTHKVTLKVIDNNTKEILTDTSTNFNLTKYKTTSYIDYPLPNTTGDKLKVYGWVMSSVENNVKVFLDNKELQNVTRVARPDVLKAITGYGDKEINKLAGYSGEYDISNLSDGNHTLTVKVYSKKTNTEISSNTKNFNLVKYKTKQHIDYPVTNIKGDNLYIQGWVMSTTDNYLKVMIDNLEVKDLERLTRKDVLKEIKGYGDITTNPTPGYKKNVDISSLKDGNHKLTIKVYSKNTNKEISSTTKEFKVKKYDTRIQIDSPITSYKGINLNIFGWVMSTAPSKEVEFYIDDKKISGIDANITRKDVLKEIKGYGDITTNPTPGYKGVYDASYLKDGTHTIKVKVINKITNETLKESSANFKISKYKTTTYIDEPYQKSTGTTLTIRGWTMTTALESRVDVYIDNVLQKSPTRIERNDVLKAIKDYGDITTNPTPGYKDNYDVLSLKDGTHKVTIKVVDTRTEEVLDKVSQEWKLQKYKGELYIDTPTSSMFSKSVTFKGWEMTEVIDSKVETYIDGKLYNGKNIRTKRNDVIQNVTDYGDATVNPTPGFENEINLSNFSNGKHIIQLKLRTKYGDVIKTYTKEIFAYNNINFGIDVSAWNGHINWNQVKDNGISFAMIRMGYRGYGDQGTLVTDGRYQENITNAPAAGVNSGVYFFTQAKNYREGQEEAQYVLNHIKGKNIKLPIAIDTEYSTEPSHNGRADHISRDDRTQAILGFVTTIEAAGYTPMIYASKNWLYNNLNMLLLSRYEIWLAHYTYDFNLPSDYSGIYQIWQYTSRGNIGGISGNVDFNIGYKNY